MVDEKLEVRLGAKTLSLRGSILQLDVSLASAEISRVPDTEEAVLELHYQKGKSEDFVEDEGARIDDFVEEEGLKNIINVGHCPYAEPPTVSIMGKYDFAVYS